MSSKEPPMGPRPHIRSSMSSAAEGSLASSAPVVKVAAKTHTATAANTTPMTAPSRSPLDTATCSRAESHSAPGCRYQQPVRHLLTHDLREVETAAVHRHDYIRLERL